jgi:peptidyl-prolyl cis-trans isomerase C
MQAQRTVGGTSKSQLCQISSLARIESKGIVWFMMRLEILWTAIFTLYALTLFLHRSARRFDKFNSSNEESSMAISKRSRRSGTSLALVFSATTFITMGAMAETVATINGIDIDSSLLDMYLESRTQGPAEQATPTQRNAVMQELTDIYLITTQPSAKAVFDDPVVKAQIELQSRAAVAQAVATDFFAKNPATDIEILAEYEEQMKAAPTLQFKASHIVVETQAAAMDLITQLDEGADFAELAVANSTGPTGPNGGELGWFSPDQMVKPFSDAVAAMADGAHTNEPVQSEFGWHVVLREASRANQPPPLESVRDVLKQRVEQNKFQGYLERLRAIYNSAG